MTMETSNGTPLYASDSEHSDLDSKSNSSASTVEDDLRRSNETETFTESNGIKSSALVETLSGIPILIDSVETVKKYKFGRMTIDLADKVSDLANPVSYKYIEKADKMAAASVQQIISCQLPFLKQPTDKIFQTVKEYHEQLGTSIEDNITLPGSHLVMKLDSQLAPAVNLLEDLLQRMVPDEDGKPVRDIQSDQQLDQLSQILRVLNIALATRDRCVEKVKKQLTSTQTYTTDQLRQLQLSNQLLSKATETVNALNQTLLEMLGNLRETIQSPDLAINFHTRLQSIAAVLLGDLNKDDNLPTAVQARIVELSAALMTATDGISAYIKTNAENFPEYLQVRLKPLVDFFGQRYGELTNEIRSAEGSPLEKARNILKLTTDHTLPALRASISDLQEAIQNCTTSLNTSFHNTTDAVKNQIHRTTTILNVK